MLYNVSGGFEVLNGRLIGPKSWNRIVVIFEAQIVQSVIVNGWFGLLGCALCYKSCVGLYEAGNGLEIRFHKVNRCLVSGREQ